MSEQNGPGAAQPVIAGVLASLVGFASTFALVLAGLRAVGASDAEAASGLATLCFTMAVVAVWLGVRYRQPLAIAWSTPGTSPPALTFTAPTLDPGALLGLALPLFVVTMASQNVTGIAVLASFGYRAPITPALVSTGAATVAGAPFGAHAINLAAITAALAAGPDAHPDPSRRWIASVAGGVTYLVLGLTAGLAAALVAVAPPLLIEAVAGLALFGALAGALAAAMADAGRREAAVITFAVSASGITVGGISAPYWGLVAGLVYAALQHERRAPAAAAADTV